MQLKVKVEDGGIALGEHVRVNFMRTLRIPDDGREYPLPPGLGMFPVLRVDDYAHHVPSEWLERGGVFIPLYQREALWLNFDAPYWHSHALKVAVGKVNAVSGKAWHDEIGPDQDYLVVPDQPWLDGINAGDGFIRQFVAMPLGAGYTVEAQVTGSEQWGGIQLLAYAPKPGRFPDDAPAPSPWDISQGVDICCALQAAPMGIGAGGRMRQKVYPDPYGWETWDPERNGRIFVHVVNSMAFREITGREPPPTPVTARHYSDLGFPWFELADDELGDLSPSDILAEVKSVKEIDAGHGFEAQQDDEPVELSPGQTKTIGADPAEVRDGPGW